VNDIVRRILPLISGTFEKNIEITTHLEDSIRSLKGDIGQLEQCILNIGLNARDAMPNGGKLVIETKNVYMDKTFLRTHLNAREGNYVVLSVTDTGIGMPPQVKEHIFEPFFTTKNESEGTGMGLATVYGITKNHGGFIDVYSEVGTGTTFKLYFPAIDERAETPFDMMGLEGLEGTETILLIDDEPIIREMWQDVLGDLGYKIIALESGELALDVLQWRKDEIDLVILDYVMPGLGGERTYEKIKEIAPELKVIISSGYSENGRVKDIISAGPNGFIQKPSHIKDLTQKIREILDGTVEKGNG
jgi:CheY-like chemotaxis protein